MTTIAAGSGFGVTEPFFPANAGLHRPTQGPNQTGRDLRKFTSINFPPLGGTRTRGYVARIAVVIDIA